MTTDNSVGTFLKREKLKWELDSGDERTDEEFAAHLGVSLGTYNKWKAGTRKPTGLYLERIAEKLGDEIYNVLGLVRPARDARFQELASIWKDVPNAVQDQLLQLARHAVDQRSEAGMAAPPVAKPARKRAR